MTSNAAAQNAILADTYALILAAGEPATKRWIAEAYEAKHGKRLPFDWAFELLESRGWIARVEAPAPVNGRNVWHVDSRYQATKAGTGR